MVNRIASQESPISREDALKAKRCLILIRSQKTCYFGKSAPLRHCEVSTFYELIQGQRPQLEYIGIKSRLGGYIHIIDNSQLHSHPPRPEISSHNPPPTAPSHPPPKSFQSNTAS